MLAQAHPNGIPYTGRVARLLRSVALSKRTGQHQRGAAFSRPLAGDSEGGAG